MSSRGGSCIQVRAQLVNMDLEGADKAVGGLGQGGGLGTFQYLAALNVRVRPTAGALNRAVDQSAYAPPPPSIDLLPLYTPRRAHKACLRGSCWFLFSGTTKACPPSPRRSIPRT